MLLTFAFTLASCTDEPNGGEKIKSGRYALSGKVEKGPFVRGSSISVQPLDESMNATGSIFNGEIIDNTGAFDVGQIELASQLVRITANGYYFNEVTGQLSSGQLHLVALADASIKKSINVNIITHLKAARVKKLVASGSKFADADRQAQKELLTQFGMQSFDEAVTNTQGITSGDDGAGVIIAISSLILNNRTDAEITELLSTLSEDLADDGAFTKANRQLFSYDEDLNYIKFVFDNADKIAQNITNRYNELDISITVPNLLSYYDLDGDGICGNELPKDPKITLSQTEVNFGKEGGTTTITIDANFKCYLSEGGAYPWTYPSEWVSPDKLFMGGGSNITSNLSDKTITITASENLSSKTQITKLGIYDALGKEVASATVTVEGNNEYVNSTLSPYGKSIIGNVITKLSTTEHGYSEFIYDYCSSDSHQLNSDNNSVYSLWSGYYQNLLFINTIASMATNEGYGPNGQLFQTYNAIIYTQMMELWGDVPFFKSRDEMINGYGVARTPCAYIRNEYIQLLTEALKIAPDEKFTGENIEQHFFLPKDIVNLALADLYLQDGKYQEAYNCYNKGVKNYPMSSSIAQTSDNSEIIFIRQLPMPLYIVSDIKLRMAECKLKLGDSATAQSIVDEVKNRHSEFAAISGSTLEQIDLMHRTAKHPGYFGFLKRSGLATTKYGFKDYQLLWPIPASELQCNPALTQNPGY